jgi:hypothetical protein
MIGKLMSRLAAPVLLCLTVILFHWKLVLTNQYTWLESPDIVYQVLPWFQFQAGEWHRFRIPLWDPTSWYGQPIFGEALPAPAYPLNWLLFWAPLKNGWMRQGALHWYFVVVRILAALSAYALCRELGRSRKASLFGGCLYALGGYVAHTDWPQTVNGAITSPLVFLYLFRAERTRAPRDALLSGFFMGFGWLAGHHQMNLLISLAAAGLWIWLILRGTRPEWSVDWRLAKLAGAAVLISVLASGLQTVPTAEYGRRALRWVGSANDPVRLDETVPYAVHQGLSLKPVELLATFIPGMGPVSDPFIGIVGLSLAVLGAILAWHEKQVRWMVAAGICGMLYALGYSSVFHGMLYALVPLVEQARTPAAGTVVLAVCIAPLSAFGLDALPRPGSSAWSLRAGRVLVAIAALLAAASLMFFVAKINLEIYDYRLMITAFAAALAAAVFAAWRAGTLPVGAGWAALLALALLELGNVTNYQLPNRLVPDQNWRLHILSEHGDLAEFIRGEGAQGRIEYDGELIPYNFGAWYGLDTMQAPGASVLEDLWRLDVFSERSRNFFGVRYWMGKAANRPGQQEVFRGARGINIYENPGAFPRAFSVHRVDSEPNIQKLRAKFADPAVDLRRLALLGSAPPLALENCAPEQDNVDLRFRSSNTVVIQAELQCRGLVILTDNWFPGWSVKVDGKSADLLRVDGTVRGVIAEAGMHRIEMRYRPWSVTLGALMSFGALTIVLLSRRYLAAV